MRVRDGVLMVPVPFGLFLLSSRTNFLALVEPESQGLSFPSETFDADILPFSQHFSSFSCVDADDLLPGPVFNSLFLPFFLCLS